MVKKDKGTRKGHVHVVIRDDAGELVHQQRHNVEDVDETILHMMAIVPDDGGEAVERGPTLGAERRRRAAADASADDSSSTDSAGA